MKRLCGMALLALGVTGLAFASPHHKNEGPDNDGSKEAPEVNPAQAASALAMLSGAMLVIRRKK